MSKKKQVIRIIKKKAYREQQLKEQHITKTIGLDSIIIYPILLT